MRSTVRSLSAAGIALLLSAFVGYVYPAAQQPAGDAGSVKQGQANYVTPAPGMPPVVEKAESTYRPVGKRVAPPDAFAALWHSTAPTPRDADGHPDLSGNWGANFPNPIGDPAMAPARRPGAFEADQMAMQRAAQWNKPLYKPEYWEKVRSLDFSKVDVDPVYGCNHPAGVPRQNVPARIVQKDKQIWLFNGVENALRIIPLDGKPRDPNDEQFSTYSGMPWAHWDGDTLVVESIGFDDVSWLQWEGYFHTDQMKVTERFRREGDLLFYSFTVDDPAVLMEPWTSITYVRRLNPNPGRQDAASPCVERDKEFLADPFLRG